MAVNNPEIVDIISEDNNNNHVVLDITDHLDWSNEREHLLMLENKINSYLSFIQSAQFFECYPTAKGKVPVIHVACYHQPSEGAKSFFREVENILAEDGIIFTYKHSYFNSPPTAI